MIKEFGANFHLIIYLLTVVLISAEFAFLSKIIFLQVRFKNSVNAHFLTSFGFKKPSIILKTYIISKFQKVPVVLFMFETTSHYSITYLFFHFFVEIFYHAYS